MKFKKITSPGFFVISRYVSSIVIKVQIMNKADSRQHGKLKKQS